MYLYIYISILSISISISLPPGAIAGLLAARYLAPALMWGVVGENDAIIPDSRAKSWAVRREALTDQYVSRLAAQAKGRSALSPKAGAAAGNNDTKPTVKNLSELSADALQVCAKTRLHMYFIYIYIFLFFLRAISSHERPANI